MRYFLLFTAFLLVALPAHAIRVMNLDKVPQTLLVNNGGELKEIPLEPNAFYNTYGPMVKIGVKGKKRLLRADPFSDYVIWPGGKLILQRRHDVHTGK